MGNKSAPKYKTLLEQVAPVRGRELTGELSTQLTFRYPDNQGRTASNMKLAWNAKNITKIITAIE